RVLDRRGGGSMRTNPCMTVALAAAGIALSLATPGRAQTPLLREIASTTLPGAGVGFTLAPDGSAYVLIEDPQADACKDKCDPGQWSKPYLARLDKPGGISSRLEIARSSNDEDGVYRNLAPISTSRGKAPAAFLTGGDIMVIHHGVVVRYDASGRQTFTR